MYVGQRGIRSHVHLSQAPITSQRHIFPTRVKRKFFLGNEQKMKKKSNQLLPIERSTRSAVAVRFSVISCYPAKMSLEKLETFEFNLFDK